MASKPMTTAYYFTGGYVDDLENVLTVEGGLIGVNNEPWTWSWTSSGTSWSKLAA